ncbi:MAG: DUF1295 domain-containing protein [Patescibacteria group bacterium]
MPTSLLIVSYFAYLLSVWLVALIPILILAIVGFLYSLYAKRNDIALVLFPVGIALSAITLFLILDYPSTVLEIVIILITIWATRKAYHLGAEHFTRTKESDQYARFRDTWKWLRARSFFQIFLVQALYMSLVLSPVIVFVFSPGYVPLWQILLGMWLWLVGFVFQVVGDWQLGQFNKTPSRYGLEKGDLMTKGIWSITRHPHYFGEICMWWGIFIITLHSFSAWLLVPSIIGPVLLSFVTYKLSGVKTTEKYWQEKHPESFEKYKSSTPVLFPRIFRKKR